MESWREKVAHITKISRGSPLAMLHVVRVNGRETHRLVNGIGRTLVENG